MAFCNYCGAKNEDGTKFCTKCGKPLQVGAGRQPEAMVQQPEGVVQQPEGTVQQKATSGDGWYIRDGNLIISMTDMSSLRRNNEFPWSHAREEVRSVIFVSGMKTIEAGAFDGFVRVESIMMPNDVSEIQGGAFQNCKSLKSVTIPDCNYKTMRIMTHAFKGCEGLERIVFPNSMPIVEEGAFEGCCNIKTAEFRGKTYASVGKLYEAYMGICIQDDTKEEIHIC